MIPHFQVRHVVESNACARGFARVPDSPVVQGSTVTSVNPW